MSSTFTQSYTSTYTEARARYVLQKAFDDLVGLFSHQVITKEQALDWYNELKYVIDIQAMKAFEFKVKNNGKEIKVWRYDVSDDGSLLENSESGGINFDDVPTSATASIVVDLVEDPKKKREALEYLHKQGWGNGSFFVGTAKPDKAFSKDGFGLKRTVYEVSE
jgi:hypothetical protein